MDEHFQAAARMVAAGEDSSGERHSLGVSTVDFKVSGQGESGLFILENRFHQKGGPARHLHHNQDEWFYIVEGEFLFEVGNQTFRLGEGASLFAPRKIPHVWASVGDTGGRILVAFGPAGKMEAFFRDVSKMNAMAGMDSELWRSYGMELLGPPLPVG